MNVRTVALAALVAGCGRQESKNQLELGPDAATSEGGYSAQFQVTTASAVTWSLDPPVGSIDTVQDGSTVHVVRYVPPQTLATRDVFTAVTIRATTSDAVGSASIRVWPDPCGARTWSATTCPSQLDPPLGCGTCTSVAQGPDLVPPPELLLGGRQTGPFGDVSEFDLATCTWTVTYPGDPADATCSDVSHAGFRGTVVKATFSDAGVSGAVRELCETETECCEPLLTDCTWQRGP